MRFHLVTALNCYVHLKFSENLLSVSHENDTESASERKRKVEDPPLRRNVKCKLVPSN